MAERVKRQRLKPEVRREKLLEAATEVFAERGYEGARVEQIADVAQVSPGLLYRHFEGKQELYEELLLLANRQLLEHLAQAAAPNLPTDQRVLRGLDAFFGFVEGHRNLWRLIMKDVVEPEIAAIREDVMRRSVGLVATLAAQEQDFGGTQPHERELEMVSVMRRRLRRVARRLVDGPPEGAAQRDRRGRDGVPVGGARAGAGRRALLGFLTERGTDLTPPACGAFIERDTAPVPVVPGPAPGRRVPLPGGLGRRSGGRRLLSGDVSVGDAGISTAARRTPTRGRGC